VLGTQILLFVQHLGEGPNSWFEAMVRKRRGCNRNIERPPLEVREKRKKLRPKETITVDLLHRAVPAVHTKDGLRALAKSRPPHRLAGEAYAL